MKTKLILLSTLSFLVTHLIFAQPTNDDCSNAEVITGITSYQNISFDITNASLENEPGCEGSASTNYADVWYEFTMPVTGVLYINGSTFYNRFSLYDTCNGSELSCFVTNNSIYNLVQGNTYLLRVYRLESHIGNGGQSFLIRAYETPENDNCNNATDITINETAQTINFSIGGAENIDEEGCVESETDDYSDIWYNFTMPMSGVLHIESLTNYNNFAIYDVCGGNKISCFNKEGEVGNLISGENYKLRIFRTNYQSFNNSGLSFTTYVTNELYNDICQYAISQNITSTPQTVTFDLSLATINNEIGCEEDPSADYVDAWYELEIPMDGELFIDSNSTNNHFALSDGCETEQFACFSGSGTIAGLNENQTVFLRVFRESDEASTTDQSFTIYMQEEILNDTCNLATELTVTETLQTVTFDISEAEVNTELGCIDDAETANYADLWYTFTAEEGSDVSINSSDYNNYGVYTSCDLNNQIDCFVGSRILTQLTANQTYWLRVYRPENDQTMGGQEFTIQRVILTSPDCSVTQPLNITTTETTVDINYDSEDFNYEYGCNNTDGNLYKDVLYEFTMPINGSLAISSTAVNSFALLSNCSSDSILCFSGEGTTYIDDLVQGESYLLRVFRQNFDSTNFQNFNIWAIETSYPTCSNIGTLTVNNTPQTVNLDIENASYNYEYGCDETGDLYADFWYQFTMPVNGNIYMNVGAAYATIYDSCDGNALYCFTENKLIDDLDENETYIIRVFRNYTTSSSFGNQFSIQTYDRIANDNCNSPDILPTLTSENTQVQFQLTGATVNSEETCTGVFEDNILDAWWQFTMPITGNLFIDTPGGNGIAVYDACNGNELFCNASEGSLDSFKLISNLAQGNTYLIRFFNSEATVFEQDFHVMNLRVYERALNDNCETAEVIPTITQTPQEIIFDTYGSEINDEVGCSNTTSENLVDVWFDLIIPNAQYLNIESYQSNNFALYDACNGTQVACWSGDAIINLEFLPVGATYKLRMFQRVTLSSGGMFHPNKNFNIYTSGVLNIENPIISSVSILTVNNTLHVKNLTSNSSLEIFNTLGQKVFFKRLEAIEDQAFNLDLEAGIYITRLNFDNSSFTKKIVIH